MAATGAGKARGVGRIVDPLDGHSAIMPADDVLVVGRVTGGEDLAAAEECGRHGLVFLCEAFGLDADGNLQTSGERPPRALRGSRRNSVPTL